MAYRVYNVVSFNSETYIACFKLLKQRVTVFSDLTRIINKTISTK